MIKCSGRDSREMTGANTTPLRFNITRWIQKTCRNFSSPSALTGESKGEEIKGVVRVAFSIPPISLGRNYWSDGSIGCSLLAHETRCSDLNHPGMNCSPRNSEGGNGNFGARQFEGAPPGSGPPNRMMDGFDHPPPSHRGEYRGGGGRGRGRGDGGRGRGGGYTPSEGDWPCPDPS